MNIPKNLKDKAIDYVEDKVGYQSGAWDMVYPIEIIEASIEFYMEKILYGSDIHTNT